MLWFLGSGSLPERCLYKVTILEELDHAISGAPLFRASVSQIDGGGRRRC